MIDVFISYSHEDTDLAERIASFLQDHKYSVWWDTDLRVGGPFPQQIENAIKEAKCVIVIWTSSSINSEWVRIEANFAQRQKVILPVVVGNVTPPLEFQITQYLNLSE